MGEITRLVTGHPTPAASKYIIIGRGGTHDHSATLWIFPVVIARMATSCATWFRMSSIVWGGAVTVGMVHVTLITPHAHHAMFFKGSSSRDDGVVENILSMF